MKRREKGDDDEAGAVVPRGVMFPEDMRWPGFETVHAFLGATYRSSRRAHSLVLAPEALRILTAELDGSAGAALLQELKCKHRLELKDLPWRVERFKRMLLSACSLLKIPVAAFPSGRFTLGLQPVGAEPAVAGAIRHVLQRSSLPSDLVELVLAFAGDAWWRCERLPAEEPLLLRASLFFFAVNAVSMPLRRLLRKVALHRRCRLVFSEGGVLEAAWAADGARLWLSGTTVWPFVTLLRCQRRRLGLPSQVLPVVGFGEVLV
jgi:hypothetical protein